MATCKITVLKRTIHQDLADEYLEGDIGPCDRFQDGQEFVLENSVAPPGGFCPWAWADIRSVILTIVSGGNLPWASKPGVDIACCSDGCRPVIFKVERID
jgi:uncharacterized repeat protein (TIGR04076 family)